LVWSRSLCTVACRRNFSKCGCYHAVTKPDWRIAIKDYSCRKTCKVGHIVQSARENVVGKSRGETQSMVVIFLWPRLTESRPI
jgi:hypothetical protein